MNWLSRWEIFALASAVFAGLTAFLSKIGVANINSNVATFIRTLVVLVATACILSYRNEWQRPQTIEAKTWIFLALSGIATGLSWLCYYRALQLGPVSKVAPVDKLSIVLAIILGIVFLNEKLTWPIVIGGGFVVLGVIVITL